MKNTFSTPFKKVSVYILLILMGIALGVILQTQTRKVPFLQKVFAPQAHIEPNVRQNLKPSGTSTSEALEPAQNQANADTSNAKLNSSLEQGRRTALVWAVENAAPSVVSVMVVRERLRQQEYLMQDPFYQFFFGIPPATRERYSSIGSGVLLKKEGIIVTNYHVIAHQGGGARRQITITLPDGREFNSQVLGEDPDNDLAVLKIKGENLPQARVGQGQNLIGEWVVAIGNPFGYLMGDHQPSVTAGVISALSRTFSLESDIHYHNMIQTDASINPGNSGGALVNASGELIGINTFILTGGPENQGSVGIGFAIPISKVNRVVEEILKYGYIRKWTTGLYAGQQADRKAGILIIQVERGSPGYKAGIQPGDRLLSVAGKITPTLRDFMEVLRKFQVGEKVTLTYLRGKNLRSTQLLLEENPVADRSL